jgi:DNA-binding NarL/FixJ family response regulator
MRMCCLLVDDNATFLSSARTLLDRQGVMIVGTASTSAEALRLAAAAESDYADLVAESPAAGFLAQADLSAAGIGRILAGEHR